MNLILWYIYFFFLLLSHTIHGDGWKVQCRLFSSGSDFRTWKFIFVFGTRAKKDTDNTRYPWMTKWSHSWIDCAPNLRLFSLIFFCKNRKHSPYSHLFWQQFHRYHIYFVRYRKYSALSVHYCTFFFFYLNFVRRSWSDDSLCW